MILSAESVSSRKYKLYFARIVWLIINWLCKIWAQLFSCEDTARTRVHHAHTTGHPWWMK